MRFLSRRNCLLFGFFGMALLIFITILSFSDYCRLNQQCVSFFVNYDPWYWMNYIFITPLIIFFSLITIPFKVSVFEAWKKFAVWGVPIVLVLTYLTTRDTGGHNFFSMDFSLYFLVIIYGLFFLTSLVIIGVTAFKNR